MGQYSNPTTTCFIAAYKRIVAGALNKAKAGNCIFNVPPDHAANSDIPGIIDRINVITQLKPYLKDEKSPSTSKT